MVDQVDPFSPVGNGKEEKRVRAKYEFPSIEEFVNYSFWDTQVENRVAAPQVFLRKYMLISFSEDLVTFPWNVVL